MAKLVSIFMIGNINYIVLDNSEAVYGATKDIYGTKISLNP
jgi:hypothetical protein